MTDPACIDLSTTYLQLKPSGKANSWAAKEFWEAVKTGKGADSPFGFLVARYEFSSTWKHWECHPNGDELLIATVGSLQFVLEIDGRERTVTLKAPNAFLIPAGTWHTANVTEPCKIIGVTPGEGTLSRPRSKVS
jgi:mannose-6-phosphate isomerase-like protein (cupin superfamily)